MSDTRNPRPINASTRDALRSLSFDAMFDAGLIAWVDDVPCYV